MVRVKPFRNLTSSTKENIMSYAAINRREIEETSNNFKNSKLFAVTSARTNRESQATTA